MNKDEEQERLRAEKTALQEGLREALGIIEQLQQQVVGLQEQVTQLQQQISKDLRARPSPNGRTARGHRA